MATKRLRGDTWNYVVKRSGLLPRPIYLSFKDEAEGDAYVSHLERLLDAGYVPPEFIKQEAPSNLYMVIRDYLQSSSVSDMDRKILSVLIDRIGKVTVLEFTTEWCDAWITGMKRVRTMAPSTIRHHVGAMARCADSAVRNRVLAINPLRGLPRGYATYLPSDIEVVPEGLLPGPGERDRRLKPGELERILRVLMENPKPEGKERPLKLEHRESLLLIFWLALGTGMRMSEIFTLTPAQIDLGERTVFLEKTKNGNKRQVPLFPRARVAVERYLPTAGPDYLVPQWKGGDLAERKRVGDMLSKQFSRIFEAAGCEGLTFHDLRHEATCWFYEHTDLTDVEIAKVLGWKSMKMALRYANLRGSKLAMDKRIVVDDEHQELVERSMSAGP